MLKKYILWFLVLTLLNLVIAPDFVLAKSYHGDTVDWPDDSDIGEAAVKGALIGLGIVLVIFLIVKAVQSKKSGSEPEEPKDQKQESKNISDTYDKQLTPSGELVVLKW